MKNTDSIKQTIVDGYKRGVCDKNGDSILNSEDRLVAKPTPVSDSGLKYHAVYHKDGGKTVLIDRT